jgi:hypothetical protein
MMDSSSDLQAVDGLAISLVGLTADVIADPCSGHQVTFVGRIDKDPGSECPTTLHDDLQNTRPVFDYATFELQSLTQNDRHFGLSNHFAEDLSRSARFKRPHRVLVLAAILKVLVSRFALPSVGCQIELVDALIKLSRQTANRTFVSDIGRSKPTRGQSAQESRGLNQDHRFAHPRRLHSCNHAPASPPVNYDVVAFLPQAKESLTLEQNDKRHYQMERFHDRVDNA